jgi:hypothetical protein
MKKIFGVMATLTLATALSAVGFAQQGQSTQPSAQPAPDAQSSQDRSQDNQTPQQPTADQQGSQPSAPDQDSSNSMPAAQTSSFTGTVVKAGGKYVLKTSDTNYQLDDQKKAKQFVGQQVKVNGTLDSNTSTIHVSDITSTS